MLTTWKQTRTTVEYPLTIGNRGNKKSTTKKNKSKKSLASEEENTDEVQFSSSTQDGDAMGAQFVPTFSHYNAFHRERVNASSSLGKSSKKRRKLNNDAAMEKVPIICITSPHRVVIMENKGEKSNEGTMIESKSRTYVARPGASSQFTLRGNIGKYAPPSSGTKNGGTIAAFVGMIHPGAQYEPSSNLLYAIRNGGAEIAIWSAVPSSALPGPDHDVEAGMINGTSGWKDAHELSADEIISARLKLPGGRNAMTLTPISIPASSLGGKATLSADGAVGCCEDGSIWLAIRHLSDGKCSKFQILVVDGSSTEDVESNGISRSGIRVTKRQKKSVAAKHNAWRLFDSCATGTSDKSSVLLSIHSVMLSEDNSQVLYRRHILRVESKGVDLDSPAIVRIESSTTHSIMQLDSTASDIAMKIHPDASSLLIVHKESIGRWLVTSVNLSGSDGAFIDSVRTFPLPNDHIISATVFSFGMLGRNIVAVLMKSQKSNKSSSSMMVLRIIDFRRKAELSSMCWLEEENLGIEKTDSSFTSIPRVKMLHDKRCHAMVTNASNGSIALLTTANDDAGLLHIVYSKLEMRPVGVESVASVSDFNSLASALRFAAIAEPSQTTAWPSLNIVKTISNEAEIIVQSTSDGNAFDEACKLLTTSAIELIQNAGSAAVSNGVIANGGMTKGSKSSGKSAHLKSWRTIYQDCCALLSNANKKGVNQSNTIVNGIKNGATTISAVAVPRSFLEVAFKETTKILLSFHRKDAPFYSKRDFQEAARDVTSVLLEILQTKLISSRGDYGIRFNSRGHIFMSILHACPTFLSQAEDGHQAVGKLHVMNAILENVQDIPEGVLVSILRFLLRNVSVDDIVAYYPSAPVASERIIKLVNQYTVMSSSDAQEEKRNLIGTKMISEALLDFTSKIVTYSKCNQSFLTNAFRVKINSSGEVETLLLTLTKLLRVGRPRLFQGGCDAPLKKVGPLLGTIQWITALTDAHMCSILKISNEGGMVVDRIQHVVRSVMAQSEFANEVRELLKLYSVVGKESVNRETKPNTSFSMMRETAVLPYTVERLAF